MRKSRLDALTGLRFVAAMFVLAFHNFPGVQADHGSQPFYKSGYIGVSLFFILSGFILGYNYLGRPIVAKTFYRARFARIYPVYMLGVAGAFLSFLFAFRLAQLPRSLAEVALQGTLVQAWVPSHVFAGNLVGWSLSVEAFFYALFPWLAARIVDLPARKAFALMALAFVLAVLPQLVFRVLFGSVDDASMRVQQLLLFFPLIHLPQFVVGIALAQVLRLRTAALSNLQADAVILASVALVWLLAFSPWRLPHPFLRTGALAFPLAAIIYGLANGGSLAGRALSWRPLVFLGEASFALYIVHTLVHNEIQKRAPATPFLPWVTTVVAIAVASLVFVRLEQPARRYLLRHRDGTEIPQHAPAT